MRPLFPVLFIALATLLLCVQAAKEVFAHMIVGNTAEFDLADWEDDIRLAQESKIDGFALNIAAQDPNNDRALDLAFEAAARHSFSLFFSFDYLAQGPWPAARVVALLQKFAPRREYFKPDGARPFVSTFEGPGSAADWPGIKAATDAFLVPDWSSVPPQEAAALAGGVVDGLFSFGAWPDGARNMTVAADRAFQDALRPTQRAYMMPVSPWFFTNLPGFGGGGGGSGGKNWLWRGDGLWDERWQRQVPLVDPDFVQVLTWNDYGESHYVGPVRDKALGLFASARAPVNYARQMTHDGWRRFLPFYVELYKTGRAPPGVREGVVAYYRTAPALACPSGGTTGNNAAFGQAEVPPEQLVEDSVFYAALLRSDAGVTVTVSIGGRERTGRLDRGPPTGAGTTGVYTGSVPFGGRTGDVVVTVSRGGRVIARAGGGKAISTACENNTQNWNAVAV